MGENAFTLTVKYYTFKLEYYEIISLKKMVKYDLKIDKFKITLEMKFELLLRF